MVLQQDSARPDPPGASFRPDIEGLRAVAILLVVGYHAGLPLLSGGYVGVDVFFVVSGYLITGLLVREIEITGRLDLIRFFAQRVRRLLPAAAVVAPVTLLAAYFLYSPQELRALSNAAIAMSLFVSNLWFARGSTDYLAADGAPSALLHSWSLAVEEQFYVVWPIFVFLAYRGLRGGTHRVRLILAMAVLGLLSLAGCIWLTRQAQPWAFFASPARAWEFAVGGLAVLVPAQRMAWRPVFGRAAQALGLLAVLVAGCMFDQRTQFPGYAALLPVLGTMLMLIAFGPVVRGPVTRVLSGATMRWIGRRSYSWYLWHWPVLVLADALIPEHSVVAKIACVGLSLALAELSFRYLENPVRFHPRLVSRQVLSLGLAITVTAVCMTLGGGWRHFAVTQARSPEQLKFTNVRRDVPYVNDSNCHGDLMTEALAACEFGDRQSKTTLVLFGDSHAAQWFPSLQVLAVRQGWRLIPLTKSGCPPTPVKVTNRQLGRVYEECEIWREKAVAKIFELRPALVLLSNDIYIDPDAGAPDSAIDAGEWQRAQHHLLSRFDRAGLNSAIISNTPRPGFDVPKCLARKARFTRRNDRCDFERDNALRVIAREMDLRAARNLPRVRFIDMTRSICPRPRCDGMDPSTGIVRYRDSDHLSAAFVASLGPALKAALLPLMPKP